MDLSSVTVYAEGRFCRYEDAKVGLLTHGLQYGTGCFEGIRGYWIPEERELLLLLLRDHYERLATSAKILTMSLPKSVDELIESRSSSACGTTIDTDIYIRPFCVQGRRRRRRAPARRARRLCDRTDSLHALPRRRARARRLRELVAALGRYDGAAAREDHGPLRQLRAGQKRGGGQRLRRGDPPVARRSRRRRFGGEHLSRAPQRALHAGSFAERARGRYPASDHGDCARELGMDIVERSIDRGELYSAEEVFFTGTAAGICYVASIDRRIGRRRNDRSDHRALCAISTSKSSPGAIRATNRG